MSKKLLQKKQTLNSCYQMNNSQGLKTNIEGATANNKSKIGDNSFNFPHAKLAKKQRKRLKVPNLLKMLKLCSCGT